MIEYNAQSACHSAHQQQPIDHRNTANTASKAVPATSGSVLEKLKRSERIFTVYAAMFHAISTGSL